MAISANFGLIRSRAGLRRWIQTCCRRGRRLDATYKPAQPWFAPLRECWGAEPKFSAHFGPQRGLGIFCVGVEACAGESRRAAGGLGGRTHPLHPCERAGVSSLMPVPTLGRPPIGSERSENIQRIVGSGVEACAGESRRAVGGLGGRTHPLSLPDAGFPLREGRGV